jgi:trans-AT polyketide synthase/acyltransferase/oxidoreductase domain-containing protein
MTEANTKSRGLSARSTISTTGRGRGTPVFSPDELYQALLQLETPLWVIRQGDQVGLNTGDPGDNEIIGLLPAVTPESLGDSAFQQTHSTRFSYYTGAMANGIASADLVIALGKAGYMGSFGSAGLGPDRINPAIDAIQEALGPEGPYAFNLINSPNEPRMEARAAQLYLDRAVRTVETSAYVDLTIPLVHYRLAGLEKAADGTVTMRNKIIAKLSRREVARLFISPAPEDIIQHLLTEGKISADQAEMARQVPVADDVTVEADSGGHTDNRPLVCMMPGMIALRNEIQAQYNYPTPVRVGAAGGISTPEAALAAFMMGAAFITTGSVNQATLEAATSDHTRKLLADASMADVIMAPSSDMFEMGVKVQVLKRGTLFPMRAQKLYEFYTRYPDWDHVPADERTRLEKTIFRNSFDQIWEGTKQFFEERDPRQIERAEADPHYKMALVFRWYLGLSSRWSNFGEKGREMDYQVWCGPSMGAFNDWVRGTYLEHPENRKVTDVAHHIMHGAAVLSRVRAFGQYVQEMPPKMQVYLPEPL